MVLYTGLWLIEQEVILWLKLKIAAHVSIVIIANHIMAALLASTKEK